MWPDVDTGVVLDRHSYRPNGGYLIVVQCAKMSISS
jgi:hypothetical protein